MNKPKPKPKQRQQAKPMRPRLAMDNRMVFNIETAIRVQEWLKKLK